MKKFSLFALALISFSILFGHGAIAATISAPALFTDGTTYENDGEVKAPVGNETSYHAVTSFLDAGTKLYVTYSFTLPPDSTRWEFAGADAGKIYGLGTFLSGSDTSVSFSTPKEFPEEIPVGNSGKTKTEYSYVLSFVLSNMGTTPAEFKTALMSIWKDLKVSVSMSSERVSNVPLPAALPLFGLGLAGLAGYKRSRRKA